MKQVFLPFKYETNILFHFQWDLLCNFNNYRIYFLTLRRGTAGEKEKKLNNKFETFAVDLPHQYKGVFFNVMFSYKNKAFYVKILKIVYI